jgi:hypothetical protein
MKVHAEVEYTDIHSDICPKNCDSNNMNDPDYVELLHHCLDEWLEKSDGKGCFYIMEENYKIEGK